MKSKQDFQKLSKQYFKQCTFEKYEDAEKSLGIGHLAMGFIALRVGWYEDDKAAALTFPVYDENRKVSDIGRLTLTKKKLSMTATKPGILLSRNRYNPSLPVLLTKDIIECAAALHLGFQAVAPFRCDKEHLTLSQSEIVMLKWLRRNSVQDIVTFSEADEEGYKSAMKFAVHLALHDLLLRIAFPPERFKSFKELLAHRPTHEEIKELIDRAIPINFRSTEDGLCIETRATHTS